MNDLERELKRALRPVDPGDAFTRAVMERARAQQPLPMATKPTRPRLFQWLPAAMAASLLFAILVQHDDRRTESMDEGMRAREQLIEALRLTSEKLDVAYQVVQHEPDTDDAGA